MSIVRVGSTKKFSANWDGIFSGGKKKSTAKKKATAKKKTAAPKKSKKSSQKQRQLF